jgi:hypothetical protein
MTDAQLQAVLKKDQRKDPPVVFDLPFRGSADLDRRKPISVAVILREVETAAKLNDGQPEGGYPLDADEGDDENVEETAQAPKRRGGALVMRPRVDEEEEKEEQLRGRRGRGRAPPASQQRGRR